MVIVVAAFNLLKFLTEMGGGRGAYRWFEFGAAEHLALISMCQAAVAEPTAGR